MRLMNKLSRDYYRKELAEASSVRSHCAVHWTCPFRGDRLEPTPDVVEPFRDRLGLLGERVDREGLLAPRRDDIEANRRRICDRNLVRPSLGCDTAFDGPVLDTLHSANRLCLLQTWDGRVDYSRV